MTFVVTRRIVLIITPFISDFKVSGHFCSYSEYILVHKECNIIVYRQVLQINSYCLIQHSYAVRKNVTDYRFRYQTKGEK